MRQDTFVTNIDDLQQWFEMNQTKTARPYFTIWRGYESKADRMIYRNEDLDDAKAAWEMMEDIITTHSTAGGSFRVFITDKPAHNVGMSTIVRIANPNPIGAAPAGIQGLQNVDGLVEKEVARQMELFHLKQEIEQLKAGQQPALSGVDQFREVLTEFPELRQLGFLLGKKLMGLDPAPAAAAPVSDYGVNGDTSNDAEGFDYDIIEPALDQLRTATNTPVEQILPRLAEWAKANPEMAKKMLQNL